ncbi:Uncharacterised protein [Legionella pneumophila]|nr:Uncharacterised protein [Legionella pneumophila]
MSSKKPENSFFLPSDFSRYLTESNIKSDSSNFGESNDNEILSSIFWYDIGYLLN